MGYKYRTENLEFKKLDLVVEHHRSNKCLVLYTNALSYQWEY